MIEILPGILEKDWDSIEKKILQVKSFAPAIHIDLIDGIFAPNTSFLNPEPFKRYSQDMLLELHMMVENPLQYIETWGKAGFRRFLGHVEMMPDQETFLKSARKFGEAGLALNNTTALSALKVPLESLDVLLVMTVKAGFSGQSFQRRQLTKLREITSLTNIPVEVDGGINERTIKDVCSVGVRRVVTTSFLFSSTPEEQYAILKDITTALQ
jgi:ribulose-phosphate 3-epimerase